MNNISQTGHWKQLTVRTSRNGDVMVWAILHPQDMSDEDKKDLREKFTDHFQNDQGFRNWTAASEIFLGNEILKFRVIYFCNVPRICTVLFQSWPSIHPERECDISAHPVLRSEREGSP